MVQNDCRSCRTRVPVASVNSTAALLLLSSPEPRTIRQNVAVRFTGGGLGLPATWKSTVAVPEAPIWTQHGRKVRQIQADESIERRDGLRGGGPLRSWPWGKGDARWAELMSKALCVHCTGSSFAVTTHFWSLLKGSMVSMVPPAAMVTLGGGGRRQHGGSIRMAGGRRQHDDSIDILNPLPSPPEQRAARRRSCVGCPWCWGWGGGTQHLNLFLVTVVDVCEDDGAVRARPGTGGRPDRPARQCECHNNGEQPQSAAASHLCLLCAGARSSRSKVQLSPECHSLWRG